MSLFISRKPFSKENGAQYKYKTNQLFELVCRPYSLFFLAIHNYVDKTIPSMKRILDSDGRILGIINVVDFLCLLFLIFLLPIIYHGYRLSQIKQELTNVERNYLPSPDIPVVKALLTEDIPVAFEMRNLTREEVSFIEKRMDQIAWKKDIRFSRLLKKTTMPVMFGTRPLTQVYGLEFLIFVRASILRIGFSEPEILFRNAKILGQVIEVNVGDRNFKGVLRSLRQRPLSWKLKTHF